MIRDGAYPGGARLEEIKLSDAIGVSRTPIREALIALEEAGLVQSEPHKGFAITRGDARLVREIFPILAALEAAAVRSSNLALANAAAKLADINSRLAAATEPRVQYALDATFHQTLTGYCTNARLLKLLNTHRALARLVDGAENRGTADRDGSVAEHAEITDAIGRGDLEAAADALTRHWSRGENVVLDWLERRP